MSRRIPQANNDLEIARSARPLLSLRMMIGNDSIKLINWIVWLILATITHLRDEGCVMVEALATTTDQHGTKLKSSMRKVGFQVPGGSVVSVKVVDCGIISSTLYLRPA
jgi:hypothetical protein